MKTTIFKTMVIVVVATLASVSLNAQEPFYDTKWEDGKIETRTRYVLGFSGLYEKDMLSEYFYDESGDFYMKVVSRWNSKKESWIPEYRIVQQKDATDRFVSIEYMTWNVKNGRYNEPAERMVYQQNVWKDRFYYLAFQKDKQIKEWVNLGASEFFAIAENKSSENKSSEKK